MTARVAIADDDYIVRMMVSSMLDRDDRFVVVGEAGDGREAIALCGREQPDILLLDVDMPVMDGLSAVPEIQRVAPTCKIVVLSALQNVTYADRARELGVAAVVDKATALTRLLDTIHDVATPDGDGDRSVPDRADEPARVAEIASYDPFGDESVETSLRPLVRLAARVARTGSAAVNIIDGSHQRTLAIYGDQPLAVPREEGICIRAVADRALLYLPDARREPSLAEHPFVTGVHGNIRLYAGAPLLSATGRALGTLCVYDSHPRELEPWQLEALEDLAWQVVLVLELRRRDAQLADAVKEIRRLTALAPNPPSDN